MGEMRDSDWSRENLLRSDWSGPKGAIYTTFTHIVSKVLPSVILSEIFFLTLKARINEQLPPMSVRRINNS